MKQSFFLALSIIIAFPLPAFSQAQEAWLALFNIPDRVDRPADIVVDSEGNVYVTGGSGTVKYDTHGNELWSGRYGGVAVAIDSSGNTFVTSPRWIVPVDTWNSILTANHFIEQLSGNDIFHLDTYYLTGPDYTTVKYSESGDILWIETYDGPGIFWPINDGFDVDVPRDLVVDHHGNAIVTGESHYDYPHPSFVTIKYDADGNELWRKTIYEEDDNWLADMDIDCYGNVYIAKSQGAGGTTRYITVLKYDPDGNGTAFDISGTGWTTPHAIDVDYEGNAVVTGRGLYDINYFIVTVAYNSNGDILWESGYGEGENRIDSFDVQLDESHNSIVLGTSTISEILLIQFDPAGEINWVVSHNGEEYYSDEAKELVLDNDANIYIAGKSSYNDGEDSWRESLLLKYDSYGNEEFVMKHGAQDGDDDSATDIAIDNKRDIYITGTTADYENEYSYFTIKYRQNPLIYREPVAWNR